MHFSSNRNQIFNPSAFAVPAYGFFGNATNGSIPGPKEVACNRASDNLSDRIGEERIVLEIPEGEHVLYYLVKLTGYMAVSNGAPGANGPVLNHLDKAAVERYLNRLAEALTAKIGDLHPYVASRTADQPS